MAFAAVVAVVFVSALMIGRAVGPIDVGGTTAKHETTMVGATSHG
jgi:hypothetical protein